MYRIKGIYRIQRGIQERYRIKGYTGIHRIKSGIHGIYRIQRGIQERYIIKGYPGIHRI